MDSQFGIAHVWTQGDFVTRAVAIILLAMSVASWLVMIIKALDIVKFKKLARNAQDFWHSPDLASGLEKLGDDRSNPFRYLVLEGREATAHHRKTSAHLHDTLDISDWVTRCMRNGIDRKSTRLNSSHLVISYAVFCLKKKKDCGSCAATPCTRYARGVPRWHPFSLRSSIKTPRAR